MEHASMIERLTVRSKYPYIVYGSVRGIQGECWSLERAIERANDDRADCGSLTGGAYSDVRVYQWVGHWSLIEWDQ